MKILIVNTNASKTGREIGLWERGQGRVGLNIISKSLYVTPLIGNKPLTVIIFSFFYEEVM